MEVTAIIVARGGSVRVPGKALREINGITMLGRKILQLKQCGNIHRIVVGSEDDRILSHADAYGAEAVRRPDYYCDEAQASANDMIGNMCELIKTDIVAWTHCTNPLISADTYDRAVAVFMDKQREGYDSLLSVVCFQEHLWNEDRKPLNYNPYIGRHTLAKELPLYYMQDGGIFIQPHAQMLENRYFFGKAPYLFEIPDEEFCDINTLRDLKIANALADVDFEKPLK